MGEHFLAPSEQIDDHESETRRNLIGFYFCFDLYIHESCKDFFCINSVLTRVQSCRCPKRERERVCDLRNFKGTLSQSACQRQFSLLLLYISISRIFHTDETRLISCKIPSGRHSVYSFFEREHEKRKFRERRRARRRKKRNGRR